MPHVKIDVSGVGSTYTDEEGFYSIDIGNQSRNVTVKLEGTYLNTNNANGSDASITRSVDPGTTEDFSFGLGYGVEYRKGTTRLQGFYGYQGFVGMIYNDDFDIIGLLKANLIDGKHFRKCLSQFSTLEQ